jgi:hypothetical protein
MRSEESIERQRIASRAYYASNRDAIIERERIKRNAISESTRLKREARNIALSNVRKRATIATTNDRRYAELHASTLASIAQTEIDARRAIARKNARALAARSYSLVTLAYRYTSKSDYVDIFRDLRHESRFFE